MGPEQAAVAAGMLRAGLAVPIHYDAIAAKGLYEPREYPVPAFRETAAGNGVAVQVLEVGEVLEWPPV